MTPEILYGNCVIIFSIISIILLLITLFYIFPVRITKLERKYDEFYKNGKRSPCSYNNDYERHLNLEIMKNYFKCFLLSLFSTITSIVVFVLSGVHMFLDLDEKHIEFIEDFKKINYLILAISIFCLVRSINNIVVLKKWLREHGIISRKWLR